MKKITYIISKVFFYIFSTFSIFVLIFSIFSFVEKYWGLNVPFVEILQNDVENYDAKISIPYTGSVVKYDLSIKIIFMWLWLFFYSIYFYALKNFFEVFITEKLFSKESIEKLKLFFKINFIPILVSFGVVVISLIKDEKTNLAEEYFFISLHLLVAFLVYFYLDLFKKGKQLQEENDLTI